MSGVMSVRRKRVSGKRCGIGRLMVRGWGWGWGRWRMSGMGFRIGFFEVRWAVGNMSGSLVS